MNGLHLINIHIVLLRHVKQHQKIFKLKKNVYNIYQVVQQLKVVDVQIKVHVKQQQFNKHVIMI